MGDRRGLFLTETMGSIAWFAMDGCWLMGSSALAGVLGVPTVLLNLLSLRFVPREWASWLSTGAMSAWACMNVLWLFGDSRLLGFSGLFAARLFFAAGALLLLASIALGRRESFDPLVARFRRLRLRQADPRRS